MTTPEQALGAHDRRAFLGGDLQQFGHTVLELVREQVVSVVPQSLFPKSQSSPTNAVV